MYSKLGTKITNDQFDFKIKNSNFIRVDNYINASTSIKFKCKTCEKIFKKKPKEFNKLKCNCIDRLNNYKNSIKNKNLIILEQFYNFKKKIKHKCLTCENTFISNPKSIKNSIYGCPFCSGKKISNKDYINKLPKDIELIGEYKNSFTKVEHKCLICNNKWYTKPNYILHMGCGCPHCASSKGERAIYNILDYLKIYYIPESKIEIDNKIYYYDFFIPELNLAVEFDGIQHFQSIDYFGGEEQFNIIQKNDEIKNIWSSEKNINLLRIPYYDIEIIEEIILNKIQSLL